MTTFTSFGQGDVMQATIVPSMWAKLEEEIGIIATSLPWLKSPAENWLKKMGILKEHQLTKPSFVADMSLPTVKDNVEDMNNDDDDDDADSAKVKGNGASAILCYGAIDVPFSQPRSLVFGHFFSGLVGVIVATIFQFDLEKDPYPRLQWLAAALATAIALVVMHLTKTTHPPAGATALMPCVDQHIWALRWYFLPVLLLSSTVVLVTAVMGNNIQRQYPKFWVAQIPPPPPAPKAEEKKMEEKEESSDGSVRDTLGALERGPL
ncbi:unnamed protein product [Alternaria alternata]